MICGKCGNHVEKGSTFCPFCGVKFAIRPIVTSVDSVPADKEKQNGVPAAAQAAPLTAQTPASAAAQPLKTAETTSAPKTEKKGTPTAAQTPKAEGKGAPTAAASVTEDASITQESAVQASVTEETAFDAEETSDFILDDMPDELDTVKDGGIQKVAGEKTGLLKKISPWLLMGNLLFAALGLFVFLACLATAAVPLVKTANDIIEGYFKISKGGLAISLICGILALACGIAHLFTAITCKTERKLQAICKSALSVAVTFLVAALPVIAML